MSQRNVPPQIQKHLRRETLYGCAICGCPILEYVQIMRNSNTSVFLPENMVALCPSHQLQYNFEDKLSESTLRAAKINPYNKMHEDDSFSIRSLDITTSVAKCKFVNTPRILVINDFDIISIKREDEKFIVLDINFFDKINNLIAIVSENGWIADKSNDWDISYKPRHLTIQNQSRDIKFEAQIITDSNTRESQIAITANGMYYNGSPIKITENEVLVDSNEVGLDLKGTVLKNYEAGIIAETHSA